MRQLEGKRAVVTGGGTGIGAGISRRLVEAGARVAIVGRRKQVLDAQAAKLGGAALCRGFSCNLVDRTAAKAGFDEAAAWLGGIDILVNNAGAGGINRCAVDGPDRWDEVIRTNLDGTYFATLGALPHLADGGRIVNISSVLGRFGVPGYTAYCASKHGVIGFTKALALELAPRRITVNALTPGWVDTDMATAGMELMAKGMGTTYEEARRQALAAVPIGRILQPEEIGDTVVFLCTEGASGMTGQSISHCGGAVMW